MKKVEEDEDEEEEEEEEEEKEEKRRRAFTLMRLTVDAGAGGLRADSGSPSSLLLFSRRGKTCSFKDTLST